MCYFYLKVNFSSMFFVLPTQESKQTALSRGIEISGTRRSESTSLMTYREFPMILRSALTWISLQYPLWLSSCVIRRTTSPGIKVLSESPTYEERKKRVIYSCKGVVIALYNEKGVTNSHFSLEQSHPYPLDTTRPTKCHQIKFYYKLNEKKFPLLRVDIKKNYVTTTYP